MFRLPSDSNHDSRTDPEHIGHVRDSYHVRFPIFTSKKAEQHDTESTESLHHVRDSRYLRPPVSTSKRIEKDDIESIDSHSSQKPEFPGISDIEHPSTDFTLAERQVLWALSLIERDALAAKLDSLNKAREGKNRYSVEDPKVQLLAKQTYLLLAKQYVSNIGSLGFEEGRLDYLISDAGAMAREHFRTQYKHFLKIAATEQGEPSPPFSTGRKARVAIESPTATTPDILPPFAAQFPQSSPSDEVKAHREPISQYTSEYEQLGLLGKGGYGHVYSVRSHVDKHTYAVKKILLKSGSLNKDRKKAHVKEVLRELQTMAKLDHPNVVRYYHGWIEACPTCVPAPEDKGSEESTSSCETTTDVDLAGLQSSGEDVLGDLDKALKAPTYEPVEDNIVFGNSSPEESHVRNSPGRERGGTFPNIMAASSFVPTTLSGRVREAHDPDLEIIPRPLNPEVAALDVSRLVLSTENSSAYSTPVLGDNTNQDNIFLGKDIIIHIKMSLHPLALSRYLSTDEISPKDLYPMRHCFHQDSTVGLLAAILDGVEYLHSKEIVHRDLKPANILLSIHQGRPPKSLTGCVNVRSCTECAHADELSGIYITPCIADFGLTAKLHSSPVPASTVAYTSSLNDPRKKSKAKLLSEFVPRPVGTPYYCPAALPRDKPHICQKLDVYSLGVIAFEMVFPFGTSSERAKVLTDLKKGRLSMSMEKHNMANGILMMVNEDRDSRWGCKEVRNWLQSLAGEVNSR